MTMVSLKFDQFIENRGNLKNSFFLGVEFRIAHFV